MNKRHTEMLREIGELRKKRCKICRKDKYAKCGCAASKRIAEITKMYKEEKEKMPKDKIAISFIDGKMTVEKYNAAKNLKMSDAEIMKQIDWNNAKFYEWKNKNGLVKRQSNVTQTPATPKITIPEHETRSTTPKKAEPDVILKTNQQFQDEYDELAQGAVENMEALKKESSNLQDQLKAAVDENEKLKKERDSHSEESANARMIMNEYLKGYEEKLKMEEQYNGRLSELNENLQNKVFDLNNRLKAAESENDRVNRLNILLMDNSLKIVERVGVQ